MACFNAKTSSFSKTALRSGDATLVSHYLDLAAVRDLFNPNTEARGQVSVPDI